MSSILLPSFIHPPGVGEYYLITSTSGECGNLADWLIQERLKADEFTGLLHLYKDGVVQIDYSVFWCVPDWVNRVRKDGVFFIGDIRRFPYRQGQKPFRITSDDVEKLRLWWRAYKKTTVQARLSQEKLPLRQSIIRAADYYASSIRRHDMASKLIDLSISLEALFSPTDKSELSYRISQNAAQFLGENATERIRIARIVKTNYDRRSKLVHGTYELDRYYDGKFVTDEDIEELASIVRRSILGYIVLFLKDFDKRDAILEILGESNLDLSKGEDIRIQSDLDIFLRENFLETGQEGPITGE